MGLGDMLGRKPARIAAWEEQQQARMNAADAASQIWKQRNREVTYAGTRFYIRTAAPGQSVGNWSWITQASLLRVPAYLRDLTKRRHDAWTVGVVRAETMLRNEKILHREYLVDETAILPAVNRLATQVADGQYIRTSSQPRAAE